MQARNHCLQKKIMMLLCGAAIGAIVGYYAYTKVF